MSVASNVIKFKPSFADISSQVQKLKGWESQQFEAITLLFFPTMESTMK
jgi:hypothetical protein